MSKIVKGFLWTNKEMSKHFGHLKDHQYKHFNRSMGVKVEGKEHFRHLLQTGNYAPYEDRGQPETKKWIPSGEVKRNLHILKNKANNKGKINIDDGYIRLLKDSKVKVELPDWLPEHYKERKGGFDESV